MSTYDEVEASTATIADRVGPAVVGVGTGWGSGTGVVVDAGTVVTNAHNIRGETVSVRFSDGMIAEGAVAAADIDGDLAVVRVETGAIVAPEWSTRAVGFGAAVFALSNPGGRGLRVTHGAVSAVSQTFRGPRGRVIPGGIEHTAPLPPGSSGGPIVDPDGRLVGINTHRIGKGFYLAQPADAQLRSRVDALGRGEVRVRPRLGVGVAPSAVAAQLRQAVGLAPRDGLLVRVVADDSPAAGAGIAVGDLIVAVGDVAVADTDALYLALDGAGAEIGIDLVRGAEDRHVTVAFAAAE